MDDSDEDVQKDMLDAYHPKRPICDIPWVSEFAKEDYFDECRPYQGEYMDYSISQTDTKLDAGLIKIHMRQTTAEYKKWPSHIKPPKRPAEHKQDGKPIKYKGMKYSHGRGPCYEFIEEKWAKERDAMQIQFREDAKRRATERKKTIKKHKAGLHEILLGLVGPDWFQELAPKQLDAMDELKGCILQDLRDGTIINVKENMAKLGLVLRPNQRHLEIALKYCCGDPVEFLLILYQIWNPNRTEYSLNDRLLLSGVVHLTIRDTLRELHIRIPSPPPKDKPAPPPPPKKEKKKTYKSPYLEPYTFKPDPPKHSGIYKNNFKQYPESMYFDYIDELREHKEDWSGVIENLTDPEEGFLVMPDRPLTQEEDLVLEWKRAQESYERLNESLTRPPPLLKRANIPEVCKHMDSEEEEEEEEEQETPIAGPGVIGELEDLEETEKPREDIMVSVQVKVTTEYDEYAELTKQKIEYFLDIDESVSPTYHQSITQAQELYTTIEPVFLNNGVCIGRDGKPIYCLGGVITPFWCEVTEEQYNKAVKKIQKKLKKFPHRFLIGGVHVRNGLPIYNLITALPVSHYEDDIKEAQEILMCSKPTYVLGSVCILKDGTPVYNIQYVSATHYCKCELMMARIAGDARRAAKEQCYVSLEQFKRDECKRLKWQKMMQKRIETIEEETYRHMRRVESGTSETRLMKVQELDSPCCLCKEAIENFLRQPRCTCSKCQQDLKERRKIFIIEGGRLEEGEHFQVITGLQEEASCRCEELYRMKVAAYEDRKARIDAMMKLKSLKKKYVINGVHTGPDGEPIYILSAVVPTIPCPCIEDTKKEQDRLRKMPEPLPKDQRYIIGGIRQTADGSEWIINGVQPFPDCDCMQIYNNFMAQHHRCMELYECFLRKIEKDTDEYFKEIERDKMKVEVGGMLMGILPTDDDIIPQDAFPTDTMLGEENVIAISEPEPNYDMEPRDSDKKFYYDSTQPQLVVEGTHIEGTNFRDQKKSTALQVAPVFRPKIAETIVYDPDKPSFELVRGQSQAFDDVELVVDEEQEFTLDLEIRRKKRICVCVPGTEGLEVDCTCADDILHKKKKKKQLELPSEYRRYIILKKLPCNYEAQIIILKKALSTLAEDGFPLAKLPDCYMLPIFKLWWRWRCGIYVSMDDRQELYQFSKKFWAHTEKCHRTVELPKLPLDKRKIHLIDWSQAKLVKKLTTQLNEDYYRKLKQAHIADGREYFPTLCDYDLPTKNFRHCIFAYLPWKEEESFARYPWHVHEYKNMRNARVCL